MCSHVYEKNLENNPRYAIERKTSKTQTEGKNSRRMSISFLFPGVKKIL